MSGDRSSQLFPSRYSGSWCDGCAQMIEEGDLIGFAKGYDRPLCKDCWGEETGMADKSTPPREPDICLACFCRHNGECA